jgi:tetratricopeptide (TPR) repeat protein
MERDRLLERLQELEREMIRLRAELAPRRSWKGVLAKAGMFLVSYWALMSFFAALATATYVKFAFNIDYFESYRNAAAVKRLSEFHRDLGDELFLRNDWKQALASYKAATAANPANTAAALGEVKCAVFLPEEGHQAYDPATAAAKLRRLLTLYPDDPQVAFLQVIQLFNTGQTDGIIEKCDAVLARHRTFAGGYLLKSYIQQGNGDFKGAAKTLESLLEFDPDNGMADSNLGYCYLFTGQQDKALAYLERGAANYPSMVNAISLAEVCRSRGELERAEAILNNAERVSNLPDIEKEYYVGGQWLWNHLPEHAGDVESPRNTITCGTIAQKRAVLKISQGLLAAAKGDGETAALHFEESLKLEPRYEAFLINKLKAAAYADQLDAPIKAGLLKAAESFGVSPR